MRSAKILEEGAAVVIASIFTDFLAGAKLWQGITRNRYREFEAAGQETVDYLRQARESLKVIAQISYIRMSKTTWNPSSEGFHVVLVSNWLT
jgi:hypothetical protein